MRFAGSADAGRRLLATIVLAAAAAGPVCAQAPQAQEAYQRGLKALAEQRYKDARAALLEAVHADPGFAGAWLDLAVATEADGDPVEAEEFLNILQARFDVPPAIAAGVARLRERIQGGPAAPVPAGWRWKSQAQLGAGRDTNANSGLSLPDLTLTLPGGSVVLPVAQAQLPRADSYVLSSLTVEGLHKAGEGEWQVNAGARARANRELHAYDTVELQAGGAYIDSRPAWGGAWAAVFPGPWRVGFSVQRLTLGGSPLLDTVSVAGVHAWTGVPCGPQAGFEYGIRNFPGARNLDSTISWLSGSAMCETPLLGSRSTLTLQAKAGWEQATHAYESSTGRPGDNTRHLEFTALERWAWQGRFGPQRLEAQFQWSSARDTQGYSPLLSFNEPRRLQRLGLGVAYTTPLPATPWGGEDWSVTAAAQAFRQTSNLEIFRVSGRIVQVTIQKSW